MDEARLAEEYRQKHSTCDIQQHPWHAVFGAGAEAGYRSALTELDALRAENARLRGALSESCDAVAWLLEEDWTPDCDPGPCDGIRSGLQRWRAALEAGSRE